MFGSLERIKNNMIRLTIIFLLLGEIILNNCAAFGQQTVIGRVVDNQSKKPIPGAKVMVVGIDTSGSPKLK
jgi:hypothetical protein